MHSNVFDTFGTPDSIEWRHRRHFVRINSRPTSQDDTYLVWNQAGDLIGEVPTLLAAHQLITEQA